MSPDIQTNEKSLECTRYDEREKRILMSKQSAGMKVAPPPPRVRIVVAPI